MYVIIVSLNKQQKKGHLKKEVLKKKKKTQIYRTVF